MNCILCQTVNKKFDTGLAFIYQNFDTKEYISGFQVQKSSVNGRPTDLTSIFARSSSWQISGHFPVNTLIGNHQSPGRIHGICI